MEKMPKMKMMMSEGEMNKMMSGNRMMHSVKQMGSMMGTKSSAKKKKMK